MGPIVVPTLDGGVFPKFRMKLGCPEGGIINLEGLMPNFPAGCKKGDPTRKPIHVIVMPQLSRKSLWQHGEEHILLPSIRQIDGKGAQLLACIIVIDLSPQRQRQTLKAEAGSPGRNPPFHHSHQKIQHIVDPGMMIQHRIGP